MLFMLALDDAGTYKKSNSDAIEFQWTRGCLHPPYGNGIIANTNVGHVSTVEASRFCVETKELLL